MEKGNHTTIIIAVVALVAIVAVAMLGFTRNEFSSASGEGEEGNFAGEATKFQKLAAAPVNMCQNVQNCGFVTVNQLDANDNHEVSFGGCPRGSTASACVNSTHVLCTGSAEFGDRILNCGRCSGNYPSGGCWGEVRGRQSSDSFAFGGCPRGSTSSVCVSENELFCMGSDEFGDQVLSCACSGEFPRARCS